MDERGRGITSIEPERVGAPPGLSCANCGTLLTGPFCAQCGQHVADFHRSVWRFVTDFLDNTFCWDNKLLRTLDPLFRRPGGLTVEFMEGRRVRYVHPLRLFLFTSAVCLALLHFGQADKVVTYGRGKHGVKAVASPSPSPAAPSATDKVEKDDKEDDDPPAGASSPGPADAAKAGDGAAVAGGSPAISPTASPAAVAVAGGSPSDAAAPAPEASPVASRPEMDAVEAAIHEAFKNKRAGKDPASEAKLDKNISSLVHAVRTKVDAKGGLQQVGQNVMEGVRQRLSWVSLGMLPVFALMLRGLYWRRESYYFLHLVFSLHYHTFLLLFWTAFSWLGTLLGSTILSVPVALVGWVGIPVYLFLALRRVYGDSVRRTWMKVLVLGGMHLLAIFAALAAIGGLAVFSALR